MGEFDNPFDTSARPVAVPNPFEPAPSAPARSAPAAGEPDAGLRDAQVGARVTGAMFDYFLLTLLLLGPVFVSYGFTQGLDPDLGANIGSLSALSGVGIYMTLQTFLISTQGQSVGKIMARTRIVRSDGSPVGFFHGVLVRSWVWTVICQVPLIGVFATFGDLITLFGEDRRTLHDRIADTRVVIAAR